MNCDHALKSAAPQSRVGKLSSQLLQALLLSAGLCEHGSLRGSIPVTHGKSHFEVLVLLKDLHFILLVTSFLSLNHFEDHCDVPHGKVVTRILGSCFSPRTSEFCFCNAVFK